MGISCNKNIVRIVKKVHRNLLNNGSIIENGIICEVDLATFETDAPFGDLIGVDDN